MRIDAIWQIKTIPDAHFQVTTPKATVALPSDDGLLREVQRTVAKGSGWGRLRPVWQVAMRWRSPQLP